MSEWLSQAMPFPHLSYSRGGVAKMQVAFFAFFCIFHFSQKLHFFAFFCIKMQLGDFEKMQVAFLTKNVACQKCNLHFFYKLLVKTCKQTLQSNACNFCLQFANLQVPSNLISSSFKQITCNLLVTCCSLPITSLQLACKLLETCLQLAF